jgi:hypothetical protein
MSMKWKQHKKYKNYEISSLGEVRNIETGNIRKNQITHKGYEKVMLYVDGKNYGEFVHRLVAQCFIDNPENKPQVNHKNGDKTDNRAINLEWCTAKENVAHSNELKLNVPNFGTNHGMSKLTPKIVCDARRLKKEGYTYKSIAKHYGVSESVIGRACKGETWGHVDCEEQ